MAAKRASAQSLAISDQVSSNSGTDQPISNFGGAQPISFHPGGPKTAESSSSAEQVAASAPAVPASLPAAARPDPVDGLIARLRLEEQGRSAVEILCAQLQLELREREETQVQLTQKHEHQIQQMKQELGRRQHVADGFQRQLQTAQREVSRLRQRLHDAERKDVQNNGPSSGPTLTSRRKVVDDPKMSRLLIELQRCIKNDQDIGDELKSCRRSAKHSKMRAQGELRRSVSEQSLLPLPSSDTYAGQSLSKDYTSAQTPLSQRITVPAYSTHDASPEAPAPRRPAPLRDVTGSRRQAENTSDAGGRRGAEASRDSLLHHVRDRDDRTARNDAARQERPTLQGMPRNDTQRPERASRNGHEARIPEPRRNSHGSPGQRGTPSVMPNSARNYQPPLVEQATDDFPLTQEQGIYESLHLPLQGRSRAANGAEQSVT